MMQKTIRYTKEDKTVLNYFFTNLNKKIFATQNFHPEVWALMQARYSRSSEGLRDSFLNLLKQNPKNFKKLVQEIKKTNGGIETQHATEKAIEFMEKWVLGFGHSSVAEGAVIGICLEGVSILATKIIEDNRLSSFIEKSTRYVSFNENSFYLDSDLKKSEYSQDVKDLYKLLFKTYINLHQPVLSHIKKISPCKKETNESAWLRSCAARRFDAIRYLLPTATMTSLGWTVNARQLEHAVSKLLSNPLKEVQEIGKLIKEEASKVLPSLLNYANKKELFEKTDEDMDLIADNFYISVPKQTDNVSLVKMPKDAEDTLIASILYRYKSSSFSNILKKVKTLSKLEKIKIFDTYMKNMGKHDAPLRELEHIYFMFDIVMDYGAFRDLQRHRITTQTNQLLTADLGYDIPKDIITAGVEQEYIIAMEQAKKVYNKIRQRHPLQAQYILPLGFRKRYIMTMNLRELHHFVKVRTTPMAHESYRNIAYQMYIKIKEKYPLLAKYIDCGYNCETEILGRLNSEEKTEKMTHFGKYKFKK